MKYNFQHHYEVERAQDYLAQLIEKKALAEITKVSARRSLNQNSYFYLLLSAYAQHAGWRLEEVKTIFKRDINPDLFVYERNGYKFLKSSRDLTKDEMSKAIDRFRDFSAEQGYPLPDASQREWITQLQNAVEQTNYYL